ncbi:tetratricopeptide repeat protein [Winogradskyella echinorum]|uniref:Tetratricopeptide repeat protein n=1 Tax=Winogradskyella echinorum TaxID=538189 RepID=A0ABR6XZP1_9FLAO|nr:tetratricopeptide repeat protein [Winogradskyella echinorum]MBC3845962.1 tetratricopeptide repeat protein [Winogradskyella echinorum]MBC5750310.1 tetratricopeptide repeat protein [Winogradskyella echinorum]
MRAFAVIVVCCFSLFGISQNDQRFEEANALYNDGKYAEAVDKYEAILDSDMHSAELYFNLGNANYKLNNIAPSIYYYEKALLLSPNDQDIKNNLAFAQNMTIDAIDKVPEVGFSRIIKNIINTFSTDTWAKIAVSAALLFVLLFLVYHFSYTTSKKRIAFITSVLSLLLTCFSVAMAFQKNSLNKKDNPAIVFEQESRVKSEANKTSEEVFRLHEGTKVQILETYKDWKKIKISDNSTGWLPAKDLKLLKDF